MSTISLTGRIAKTNSLNPEKITMISRWTHVAALSLSVVLLGCGNSAPDLQLVPISGTVKLGGAPAKGIRIAFVPTGSTPGKGAIALANDSGEYEMIYDTGKNKSPGIPTGTYTVLVSDPIGDEGAAAATKRRSAGNGLAIPRSWNIPSEAGSHNMVTVSEDQPTLDLDIPLSGKVSIAAEPSRRGPRAKLGSGGKL